MYYYILLLKTLIAFQMGALGKMRVLETLHISPTKNVRDFNIPLLLQYNYGLHNLHIEASVNPTLHTTVLIHYNVYCKCS